MLDSPSTKFSLLDARPLQKMSAVCEKYDIKLLTYGSFVRVAPKNIAHGE